MIDILIKSAVVLLIVVCYMGTVVMAMYGSPVGVILLAAFYTIHIICKFLDDYGRASKK